MEDSEMREPPRMIPTRSRDETESPLMIPEPDFGLEDASRKTVQRLRLLWDERRLLSKVVSYGLVFGILLAFLLPKHYRSEVQLMPPDSNDSPGMAMMAALAGGATGGALTGLGAVASDLMGLKNTGALFVGILSSRTVQDRLIARFELQKVYGDKYMEDTRKELASNTEIAEDHKSGIITIDVTDKDPQRAAAMAQTYVQELDRLAAEVSTSAARRERMFLEERLKQVKSDLAKAAVAFSQFASKNTAIDIEEQAKAMVGAAAAVQGQMIAAQSELKGLEQIYTSGNVRVRSLKSQIAELEAQQDKLRGKAGEPPSQGGPAQYPSIRQLPLLGVTYFDLFREAKIQEAVYEALTQQYEMAKVQEAKEIPTVKVLDLAVVAEQKSFPPRFLVLSLCTFCAFMGGAGWILAHARWDRTDSRDPGKALAREVLQSVNAKMPWSTPNGSRLHRISHKAWMRMTRSRSDNPPSSE
jgi:capsule polysaccharide export protein KpsE/RkpR